MAYVQGGTSTPTGDGIHITEERKHIRIWVDPGIPNRLDILSLVQNQGGRISNDHTHPNTKIIILHPSSVHIFGQYCHPAWLPVRQRARYLRSVKEGMEEEWRIKVVLSSTWPRVCDAAGRFLGEEDDWGGCRKGG